MQAEPWLRGRIPRQPACADFSGDVGGVDLHDASRFSIRFAEVHYLATTFANGGNNHRNILRIRAGVGNHFGR